MRTRSVSVCLVLAGMFAATTAHAEGLPNGAVLEFRRLNIKENGGGFQEPSTSDVLRMYLNQAHCVCAASGAGNEQEIEWELALNPQVTTGLGKPVSLWVGTNCSDDVQRPMTCKQTGTIADIDMLAVSTARGSWNLADLINGTSTTSNCAGIDKATAWALVDTDGNGTPDYNLPKDVGSTSSPAVTVDTTPPPLPTDFKAQSAEGGVRLSWTLPTANMTDIKFFQALCAEADGNPREGTATAPRYQTADGLCGVNLVPVLEPSAIEGVGEGASGEELHDAVEAPVAGEAGVEDGDDAGVAEGGDEFDLALEASAGGAGGEGAVEEDLDGDGSAGGGLDRGVNNALAAAADLGEVGVAGDRGRLGGVGGARRSADLGEELVLLLEPGAW